MVKYKFKPAYSASVLAGTQLLRKYQRGRRRYCFALIVCGMFLASVVHGQTWKWHSAGKLPATGNCGYFWDENVGVVAAGDNQFFYTRDGVTWQLAKTLSGDAHIWSIRSFDGVTLYAGVTTLTTSECWSSTDSGRTWTLVQSIPQRLAEAVDVYWTTMPVLAPFTVARMQGAELVESEDDSLGPPKYSHDGGQSWNNGFWSGSGWGGNAKGGLGLYADTAKNIFYAISEASTIMVESTDFGSSWFQAPPLPTTFRIDDLEGIGSRMYIQTSTGLDMTTNGGITWDTIGGPSQYPDDVRFCVYGCDGLIVTAFDDTGGVWTGSALNLSPTIHSTFATTATECDSSALSITVDSFFVTGRVVIKLYGDLFGAFRLLGSDTVQASNGSIPISIQFSPKDLLHHVDSIAIISLDFPCAPTIVHAFTGQATFVPAIASAPKAVSSCSGGTAFVLFTNPGCEALHITSATSTWAGLSILHSIRS